MTNANWGLQDWGAGTSYEPQGGFFQRGIDGSPTGLTQGAFRGLGAGLQGAGKAMMQPPGRPPGEMAMMGLANGAQNARRAQGAFQGAGFGMSGAGDGVMGQSRQLSEMGLLGFPLGDNRMPREHGRPFAEDPLPTPQSMQPGGDASRMFRGGFALPWQR